MAPLTLQGFQSRCNAMSFKCVCIEWMHFNKKDVVLEYRQLEGSFNEVHCTVTLIICFVMYGDVFYKCVMYCTIL